MPASDSNAPVSAPGPRLVLVICCLAALPTIVHALTQSLFGGVMTDIRSMLEVSSFGMGVMAAAFNLPSVLLQPGAGALVDRLGAQRMLTAATVGYAACCAWFAFSGSASNATAARWSAVRCAALRCAAPLLKLVRHRAALDSRSDTASSQYLHSNRSVAAQRGMCHLVIIGTLLAARRCPS